MSRSNIALCVGVCAMLAAPPAFAGAKEEMLAADKAFSDLSIAKGAHAAFLAFMSDDALLYEGAHPPVIGRKAAEALYADEEKANPNYKSERLEWTPLSAEASSDGTLGYTRGTWTFAGKKKDGSPLALKGYYVTEWRKQADGTYKFVLDMGGSD